MTLKMGRSVPRLAGLAAALLLTTGLTVPAWGQIETVVVTAEKKAEDIQTVPIAVTALSQEDLRKHQITQFKDLQFNVPNVTYTNTNFGGANFQIRGIGIAAIGYDAESGTAVHIDDVFLSNPPLTEATFFDVDRIEVLRGPQSTLYGRGATGGTVNIITAKPQLSDFSASGDISYGNFDASEVRAMVNIPIITDMLGIRFAADLLRHGGFVKNIADNKNVDSNDTYSGRASIRFQPTTDTTIDLIGAYSHEGDSHMRAVKQLCTRDPTAVLGCLPDSAGTDALNVNAQFTNTVSSSQGFAGTLGFLSLFGYSPSTLGLFDLTQLASTAPGNVNPKDFRQINSDFDPRYKTSETFVALTVKQNISSWLNATFVAGYEDHSYFSQESYNNIGSVPLNQSLLGTWTADFISPHSHGAEGELDYILTTLVSPAYAALFAPFFTAHPGQLPVSTLTNLGITGNSIAYFSPNQTVYDQSDSDNKQYSAELRFNSSFDGPVNFLVAGYYLRTQGQGDYFVPGNVIDYPGIVLGSILGPILAPGLCVATGCTFGPTYYHNWGRELNLESKALFGEIYYDAIPDELKFTLGARFTDDSKSDLNRIAFLSGLIPLGSTNEGLADAALVAQHQTDYNAVNGTPPFDVFQHSQKSFDKWTGRAVVDWTPHLDFTDQTLVYASYSRGYKSGGFNPGAQPDLTAGVNPSFEPEGLDAFELGTKNTLLDGMLQANLTAWYYNYQNFQVSAIIQNTSVNSNVGARLWGLEGEFVYQPDEDWVFTMNFGHTDSSIGDTVLVDPRNPSGGRSDVILIKDATATGGAGQNCVVYRLSTAVVNTPADAGITGYFAPAAAAGGETGLAAHGVAFANFGACAPSARQPELTLEGAGFSYEDPLQGPIDATKIATRDASGGVGVRLQGNEMPYSPPWSLSASAQYTYHISGGYTLIPRIDFYWQDKSWMRVFEDGADVVKSYTQVNAQATFFGPDQKWYVQGFVKNLENNNAMTGGYLTSSTSALYTNAFLVDPRTYGIRVGATF